MARAKPADSASTKSSNMSTKTLKSFKAAATSTLKAIKRKAIDIVSPQKKRKKSAVIPDASSDTSDGELPHPSRKASVIDVDEDDDDDEPGKKDNDELGKCQCFHVEHKFTYQFNSFDDEIMDLAHLCILRAYSHHRLC